MHQWPFRIDWPHSPPGEELQWQGDCSDEEMQGELNIIRWSNGRQTLTFSRAVAGLEALSSSEASCSLRRIDGANVGRSNLFMRRKSNSLNRASGLLPVH